MDRRTIVAVLVLILLVSIGCTSKKHTETPASTGTPAPTETLAPTETPTSTTPASTGTTNPRLGPPRAAGLDGVLVPSTAVKDEVNSTQGGEYWDVPSDVSLADLQDWYRKVVPQGKDLGSWKWDSF